MPETTTYYALKESDEERASGLFLVRESDTHLYHERIDWSGAWAADVGLIDYLVGNGPGSERVSEEEARNIATRLGGELGS